MAALTLWLLRHAEVPQGRGLCHGRLDLPADAAATRAAAQAFAAAWPAGEAAVWWSPLQRCRQLAARLQAPGLHRVGEDARLAELDFGAWEGRAWTQLDATDFAPWMADFGRHRVGGDGESVNTLLIRVNQALRDTAAHSRRLGHDRAVWVSHAGVARALQLLLRGETEVHDAAAWPAEAPAPGAWQCFTVPASAAAPPA